MLTPDERYAQAAERATSPAEECACPREWIVVGGGHQCAEESSC